MSQLKTLLLSLYCLSILCSCGGPESIPSKQTATLGSNQEPIQTDSIDDLDDLVIPPSEFNMEELGKQSIVTNINQKTNIDLSFQSSQAHLVTQSKILRIKRNGFLMPIPLQLELNLLTLSWVVDPTYFGDYVIDCEFVDNNGKKAYLSLELSVALPSDILSISNLTDDALKKLDQLWSLGQASGNINDWYKNKDNLHVDIKNIADRLPQIGVLEHDLSAFSRVPGNDKVVVANASLAYTSGDYWASLTRYNFVPRSLSIARTKGAFKENQMLWYPEHNDHDGSDYFHMNQLFVGISQGSSGSERDEVEHDFYGLASFRPEVKTALVERGELMGVLQMARRWTRVNDVNLYLSGQAHTTVFDNVSNSLEYRKSLIDFINGISADKLPPVAQISIESETYLESGSEHVYTHPLFINRIWRGDEYTKTMILSAETSYDINGRRLTYQWKVLRGESTKVRIVPLDEGSKRVRLEIDYHEKRIPANGPASNRVDIGLFVNNGYYYSMPAMISSFTLDNETRVYDNQGKLTSKTPNTNYVHPALK